MKNTLTCIYLKTNKSILPIHTEHLRVSFIILTCIKLSYSIYICLFLWNRFVPVKCFGSACCMKHGDVVRQQAKLGLI